MNKCLLCLALVSCLRMLAADQSGFAAAARSPAVEPPPPTSVTLAQVSPHTLLSADVITLTNCELRGLLLTFSGALQAASAEQLENYALTGAQINQAITFASFPELVYLMTSPLTCGSNYQLSVTGLLDAEARTISLPGGTVTTSNTYCCNQTYTLDLPAGFSLLANQLSRGGNTLSEVLPTVPEGTVVQLKDGEPGFRFSDGRWDGAPLLEPGRGFFLGLPEPAQITFEGAIPTSRPTLQINEEFVVVSYPFPRRANFFDVAGLAPESGFILYRLVRGSPSIAPDSGNYRVYVFEDGEWSGGAPQIELGEAVLIRRTEPPEIRQMTLTQFRVSLGSPFRVSFVAAGGLPLTYQWRHNGTTLRGQTSPVLSLSAVGLAEGGTYDLLVGNEANVAVSQRVLVGLDLPTLQLSDDFADAVTTTAPSGLGRADNTIAKTEIGELPHAGKRGGRSLWMNWTSAERGIATFRSLGSGFDTLLAAYVGETVTNLAEVASDDDAGPVLTSTLSFQVEPDVLYHIVVDGYEKESGELVLSWQFESTAEELPRIVAEPRTVAVLPGEVAQFEVEAAGNNLSYQWFFDGGALAGQTGPTLTLPVTTLANIGSYVVRVSNGQRSVESQPAALEYSVVGPLNELGTQVTSVKFNDLKLPQGARGQGEVQSAALVRGYTGTQIFSTVGAVNQPDEPPHCGVIGSGSHWFAYLAPADGLLSLSTEGSNFDTVLAVYLGGDLNSLESVACDRNNGSNGVTSKVSFEAHLNTLYYIAVDGENGQQGTVVLNYALLIPVKLSEATISGNQTSFRVTSTPAYPLTIERSSNYLDWVPFFATNSPAGSFLFQDQQAISGRLYYRVTQAP